MPCRSSFEDADLIVTYNGKTFDVPVMETRWLFHRMEMPLDGVPHFDAAARGAAAVEGPAGRPFDFAQGGRGGDGCRLTTLERALFDVRRVGDVPGIGDPFALLPVPAQRRSASARAGARAQPARSRIAGGGDRPRRAPRGRRGGWLPGLRRRRSRSAAFTSARARGSAPKPATGGRRMPMPRRVRAEGLYRLGLMLRRDRRFAEAADVWRALVALTEQRRLRAHRDGTGAAPVRRRGAGHPCTSTALATCWQLASWRSSLSKSARISGGPTATAIASRGSIESLPKKKTLSSSGAERLRTLLKL